MADRRPTTVRAWQEAVSFAARAHRAQLRRDGETPYVAHVFRVAMTVRDVFGCDDAVCLTAALLHDVIEDTPTDYDDVAERFGDEVAACVAALSKNMLLPEAERERDYDRRLGEADWRARLVKLADAYDNLSETVAHRQRRGALAKVAARAERAAALARADVATNGFAARAVEALESLIAHSRGNDAWSEPGGAER